jgi:hypothetical protein
MWYYGSGRVFFLAKFITTIIRFIVILYHDRIGNTTHSFQWNKTLNQSFIFDGKITMGKQASVEFNMPA